jgi:hypothetical protein
MDKNNSELYLFLKQFTFYLARSWFKHLITIPIIY